MRGSRTLLLVVLVMLVTPTLAAPAVATGASLAVDSSALGGPTFAQTASNNSTASGPTLADRARVTAVSFDKEYLRVERTDEMQWNTTGPYAVFAVSEPVDAARIAQPGATATVLDGGHTVRVAYSEDAAPSGSTSLYTMDLFFEDDSNATASLFARQTNQIVASAELQESAGFIETMKEDAVEHGYEPTIEGIEDYHAWEKEQADIFTNLFGPQFEKLFGWFIITITTPFAIIFFAGVIVLAAWRMLQVHGWKLRAHQNAVDLREQSRQQMRLAYFAEQDAADEERLEDLDEIGPSHIYWSDAFDVQSVKQLADLFAFGKPAVDPEGHIIRDTDADPLTDHDGETLTWDDGTPVYPPIKEHCGYLDLQDAEWRDTWLEPILRPDMLGDEQTALAHAKRALMRMTTHYGQADYRTARAEVRALLDDLDQEVSDRTYRSRTSQKRGNGRGVPGGDD